MALLMLPNLLCALVVSVQMEDLPPDAKLHVAIKYRPEKCTRKAKTGDLLSLHYEGRLRKDGSKIASSRDQDSPFVFALGSGQLIKGWDQG